MINPGRALDEAVTLLGRALGSVTRMVVKRRISRAALHEAAAHVERALKIIRAIEDD